MVSGHEKNLGLDIALHNVLEMNTSEPNSLILVSFFSEDVTSHTDTIHRIKQSMGLGQAVFSGPPCMCICIRDWGFRPSHITMPVHAGSDPG